jgi:hypothetical protein
VIWTDAANIRVTTSTIERDLADLNPVVERDGSSGARIDLDIPDEHAATDKEAGDYALRMLNQILIPDDEARVVGVALDSSVEPDGALAPELQAAPAKDESQITDVEEVPLDDEA